MTNNTGKSTIKFQCGCGFSTIYPLEAAIHSDTTGHILEVTGHVYPDKPKEKK